jgi:hypothetical protein
MALSTIARKRTSLRGPASRRSRPQRSQLLALSAADDNANSLDQGRSALADAILGLQLARRAVDEDAADEGADLDAARRAIARAVEQLKAAAGDLLSVPAANKILPALYDGLDVVLVVQAALSLKKQPHGQGVTNCPLAGALGVAVGVLGAAGLRLPAAAPRTAPGRG